MRLKAALLMVPLVGLALTRNNRPRCRFRRRPRPPRAELSRAGDGARSTWGEATRACATGPRSARYREQNRTLAAPAAGESRVVFMGDSITDAWPRRVELVLRRQGVRRPRHQRPDHAADAHPLSSRRRRSQGQGRRHPGRHQRHRREHRSDDQRRDSGESHVDGRDRQGQRHPRRLLEHSARSARITRRRTACRRRFSGRWPASARSTTG